MEAACNNADGRRLRVLGACTPRPETPKQLDDTHVVQQAQLIGFLGVATIKPVPGQQYWWSLWVDTVSYHGEVAWRMWLGTYDCQLVAGQTS